jgi:DNA-binding XRE family transcriptional regulator
MRELAVVLRRAMREVAQQEAERAASRLAQALRDLRAEVRAQARTVARPGRAGRPRSRRRPGGASRSSAAQVRAIRARLGLSQRALAEAMGVSGVAVFKWETGRSAPNPKNMARLRKLRPRARARR